MFDLADPYSIIVNVCIIVFCTLLSGMMSGLNLAYFSLDVTSISSLAMGTNSTQASRAKRILLVLQHPHWLLVTILLMNALGAESLPLALDDMVGPAVAIPVSVLLVLFFGEIIPQSIFINNAIPVCAFFSFIIYAFMILTAPISLPIGLFLDKVVGHRDGMFYRRRELREFITLQAQPFINGEPEWTESEDSFEDVGGVLDKREIKLMMGALSLSETQVRSAMKTHIEDAICVNMEGRVTKDMIERVFLCGKSRIPVFTETRECCTHYLLSKTLVLQTYQKEEDAPNVRDLSLVPAHYIDEDALLGEAYQILTARPVHMLFVCETGTKKVVGILTASDVFEIIHSVRFTDETDLENQKPMQLLLKSCWSDKNRELRGSGRRSRGPPLPQSGSTLPRSSSYANIPATRNTGVPPTQYLPPSGRPAPSPRTVVRAISSAELPPSVRSDSSKASKGSKGKQTLTVSTKHASNGNTALMDSLNRNSYGTTL